MKMRRAAVDAMLFACSLDRDNGRESCGLIVRQDSRIMPMYLDNVHERPAENFLMDGEQTKALMTSRVLDVVGMYHSHPGGKRGPSRRDRAAYVTDGWWYLVCAGVNDGWVVDAFVSHGGLLVPTDFTVV